MNCKLGDLAVIVRSFAGNDGKIVRCIRFAGLISYTDGTTEPSWYVDCDLKGQDGSPNPLVSDYQLRPIRPNEGDDETLTWAGKPEGVTA